MNLKDRLKDFLEWYVGSGGTNAAASRERTVNNYLKDQGITHHNFYCDACGSMNFVTKQCENSGCPNYKKEMP